MIRTTQHSLILLIALLLHLPGAFAAGEAVTLEQAVSALKSNQRVYDFAGVLSADDERRIHDRLAGMEQAGTAEGAVVLVDAVSGRTRFDFARDLAEAWKIGSKEKQNGFLLLVSLGDRKARIVTGTGLEGALPDLLAADLMRRELAPALKDGRYADGIDGVLAAIDTRLKKDAEAGEDSPAAPREPAPPAGAMSLLGLLSLSAAVLGLLAWPRGAAVGRDPWRVPVIIAGFAALAVALLAASQSSAALPPALIVAALPAGFATVRLFETRWLPVPLPTVSGLLPRWMAIYVVMAVAGGFALASSGGIGYVPLFLLLAVLFGFALRAYLSRAPRMCPECRGPLRWLRESEEGPHLQAEESLEQALRSVEYDLWRCDKCQRSAVIARARPASPYAVCPRCSRRTVARRSVYERSPGAWGGAVVTHVTECENPRCDYRDVKRPPDEGYGYGDNGPGILILPPILGGWGGGGGWGEQGGGSESGGFGDLGGIDVGGFGGGGDFGGGGAEIDW